MLFPEGGPIRQKCKNPIGHRRFAPSSQGASIGLGCSRAGLPDIVVPPPQVASSDLAADQFSFRARSLLTRKFRVAISGTIGRSTVRFATKKLSKHPEARLWRGTQKCVATSFLRLDQETGDAKRHRQVVQPDQGLWVHQADGRR